MALAPKHLPDELEFLDPWDEITFSKPVRDGFKEHFRTLAHASETSRDRAAVPGGSVTQAVVVIRARRS